jgi:cell division protein ZapA
VSSSTAQPVSIRLLDREYTVGCEPDERDSLVAAAKLLDSKMREIRGSNRMAALDRVAVLAALNFAHELQQLRGESEGRDRELARTLDDLHRKLDGLFDASTPR